MKSLRYSHYLPADSHSADSDKDMVSAAPDSGIAAASDSAVVHSDTAAGTAVIPDSAAVDSCHPAVVHSDTAAMYFPVTVDSRTLIPDFDTARMQTAPVACAPPDSSHGRAAYSICFPARPAAVP